MKFACNIGKDELISFGTNFGKFTKTGKFRLHVTALDFLAPYAKVCVCVLTFNRKLHLLELSFYWETTTNFYCLILVQKSRIKSFLKANDNYSQYAIEVSISVSH